jgi:hypothetical protein
MICWEELKFSEVGMTIINPVAFLIAICIFGVLLQLTGQVDGIYNPNNPNFGA